MEGLATRYAAGLLSLAHETNTIRGYKDWIVSFDEIMNHNEEFKQFLTSEFVSLSDKETMIDTINPSEFNYGANFLKLLVAKKRFSYFHAIRKEFVRLANAALGIKEGMIYTKLLISEKQMMAISERIASLIGCEVELKQTLDSQLLGGFKVIVQGQIFDYTLDDRLAKLASSMLERGDNHAHKR